MSDYSAKQEGNGGVLTYRLTELARSVRELMNWRREVDIEREKLRNTAMSLEERMDALQQSVDSLRKVLLGFAFTVAGSAIVFSLTVLIATGKIGGGGGP